VPASQAPPPLVVPLLLLLELLPPLLLVVVPPEVPELLVLADPSCPEALPEFDVLLHAVADVTPMNVKPIAAKEITCALFMMPTLAPWETKLPVRKSPSHGDISQFAVVSTARQGSSRSSSPGRSIARTTIPPLGR
jgi:hypothetical protein